MKKVLLVALALSMGMSSFAQFDAIKGLNAPKLGAKAATWYMQENTFTTYDFRDTQHANPISLAAWQDSGYFVVLDNSATWCGPCMNLHQAGILDAYYEQLGPNGTNQLRVLWNEGDASTTSNDILGTGSNTQGDWTMGGTIEFPMSDDANIMTSCFNALWQTYAAYPCVILICPNGAYRSLYGEEDGIYSFNPATCVSNLQTLMANYPRANVNPIINISGPLQVLKGNTVTFDGGIVDISGITDPITDITWTITGATTTTGNSNTITTSWDNTGDYTVTLSVTNTTGTTTQSVNVNVFEWNWGNTMSYCLGHESEAEEGYRLNGGTTSTWGVMFPARYMTGRQYLKSVDFYAVGTMNYTLRVYQGGDNAPETEIYSRTVKGQGAGWQSMNCSGAVSIDQSKNLWIALTAPHAAGYVMSVAGDYYSGDPNGSWASANNQWSTMAEMGYEVTWALKATTGDQPNVNIDGVSVIETNVYPNPTTGMVTIEAENLQQVSIMDIAGRTVMTSTESVIDMSSLANGVYMFRISTANGTTTQKVVKR